MSSFSFLKGHSIIVCVIALFMLFSPKISTSQNLDSLPSSIQYEFIFDDFVYFVPTDYPFPADGEGGSEGTLLGPNQWIEGSPSGTPSIGNATRAWYSHLWMEQSQWIQTDTTNPSINTTSPTNFATFSTPQGSTVNDLARITTGFVADKGTWVARMRLSELPPLSKGEMVHAFWLQSSHWAIDRRVTIDGGTQNVFAPGERSWFETNFEIWNEFLTGGNYSCRLTDADPVCPASTGITYKHRTYLNKNNVLRAYQSDQVGTCRVVRYSGQGWGDGYDLPQNDCHDIITNKTYKEDGDVYVYLFIQITDTHLSQLIYARDEDQVIPDFEWLQMETHGMEFIIPPQVMRTMFDINVEPNTPLEEEFSSKLDWFFYSPRTDLNVYGVMADVSTLRGYLWDQWAFNNVVDDEGRAIIRMNTTGKSVAYPHAPGSACYTNQTPSYPDKPFNFEIRGPFVNRNTNSLYFESRPIEDANSEYRHTTYNIGWKVWETIKNSGNGLVTTDLIENFDSLGFDYVYEGPPSGYTLEKLKFEVTYTDTEWTLPCTTGYSGPGPNVKTKTQYYIVSGGQKMSSVNTENEFGSEVVINDLATQSNQPTNTIELHQNYPNPFNPTTYISFTLPEQQKIELTVYDVLGREVWKLANGVFDEGSHSVQFDAINLPNGRYFYQLKTGSDIKMRSMLLMK